MKNLIFVMGAERVGKSTFCSQFDSNTTVLHFGPPNPTQPTWHSDYDRIAEVDTDNIACDRGPLEAGLFRPISISLIQEYYKQLESTYNVKTILIQKHWSNEMMMRHTNELLDKPCSTWYLKSMLEKRMREHYEYYAHIESTAYQLGVELCRIQK